jgi:hypothetical protein
MFSFEADSMLVEDREDLIAVLRMRFGSVSGEVIQKIYEMNESSSLQRLILAAANARSYEVFLEELQVGKDSFRLVGEEFNPLGNQAIGWDG